MLCLLAIAAGLTLPASARGEIIVYDGFDYPPGASLDGLGHDGFSWGTSRWSKQSAVSDWLVASNSLIHPSIPATGGHVAETNITHGANYERTFATHVLGDGESVWFSFLVRVTQGATWSLFFTYSGLGERKFGVAGNGLDYTIYSTLGTGAGSASTNSALIGQNVTRLIVGRYRHAASDAEQLDVWIDPDITIEPQPGGPGSSNHIVHVRQLDAEPDRMDCVKLENRSLGAVAFDELRVGTTWDDVISRAVDTVAIHAVAVTGSEVALHLDRLTPGATTTIRRSPQLESPSEWESVDSFVPSGRSTNWTEPRPVGERHFYRIQTH